MDNHRNLQDVYILEYFQSLDCPRSLACWLLYVHQEHLQLSELEFDPTHYINGSDAKDSLAATKFLSKAKFLKTGNDLKAKAIEKFLEAEQLCEVTNENFMTSKFSNYLTQSVLANMIVKIRKTLSDFTADELADSCNWGPGASTLLRRREASYPTKFDVERQITPRAYDFVKSWFHLAYPHWECVFEIVSSSKIVTVPKNAKTDRIIAIEPGINLWFQKGIGAMIRKRLRHQGIDLNDQGHNQRLSRIGSKFNTLATIDFSSASDTISRRLVEEVLPPRWFALLNSFKVDSGLIDGKLVNFHKFSSMGNGFTFELESLIFYSLAVSVCYQLGVSDRDVSVFGDDVILPSSCVDLFVSVSRDLGFVVNKQKSYSSGYFRESCGSYFWDGVSVKPIFLKESLAEKTEIVKAANSLRRYSHNSALHYCERRFLKPWRTLKDHLGRETPRISDGFGDLGLVVNFDETIPTEVAKAKHGIEGFYVRLWSLQNCQRYFDSPGLNLYKLRQAVSFKGFDPYRIPGDGDSGNTVPLSGRFRHTKTRILIPRWVDLGKWI